MSHRPATTTPAAPDDEEGTRTSVAPAANGGDLQDTVLGAGLLAGAANVIMQLAHPSVGYGVHESRVESGRLFDHPIKRTRTTLTYLAVAILGSDEERTEYRRAVNQAHAQVYSTEDSPVKYHAMNPDLQLWVAACLYRGFEDSYEALVHPLTPAQREQVYRNSSPLGTTLQVRASQWPADRAAFGEYWEKALTDVAIDDTIREHLLAIARLQFLPAVLHRPLGRFNLFVTTGYLPTRFREEMGLHWTAKDQRRWERLMRTLGGIARRLPRVMREFPYNAYLLDLRFRLRRGLPLI